MNNIVVTGGNGYIGSSFTDVATERGHHVTIASRQQPSSGNVPWLYFDLASYKAFDLPLDTDILVHLAANISATEFLDIDTEVAAAQELIKLTKKAKAKFIFVSSQTAREHAPTDYGRSKWHIEQAVLAAGGWVVRPGQVYGGELRGLYGALVNSVSKLLFLPAFIPTPKIQPIHVLDLTEGLLQLAERDDLQSKVYCLAEPLPIPFSSFLAEIAVSRLRCKIFFLPIPTPAVRFFMKVAGTDLKKRLGLTRLNSLFDLPKMTTASDLKMIGLSLRSLPAGLHPSGNNIRRRLLREAKTLLTYVLKERPDSVLLRRYVRCIEALRGGRVVELPKIFLSFPILLSLIDSTCWRTDKLAIEFAWRMDAATLIAEASPLGASRFLGISQPEGMVRSICLLATSVVGEVFWRLMKFFVSPVLRLALVSAGKGLP